MADNEPPEESSGGSLDSFFSTKYGPLPGWAWLGIAAGGAGLYLWYRNKKAAAAAASTSTGTSSAAAQGFDYGPSYAAIQSEVQGLQQGQAADATEDQSASTGTGTSTSTGWSRQPPVTPSGGPSSKPGAAATVTVPNVVGAQVNTGISQLGKWGLGYVSGSGDRNPKDTYQITGQNPPAGTKVAPGTKVTLTWKQHYFAGE